MASSATEHLSFADVLLSAVSALGTNGWPDEGCCCCSTIFLNAAEKKRNGWIVSTDLVFSPAMAPPFASVCCHFPAHSHNIFRFSDGVWASPLSFRDPIQDCLFCPFPYELLSHPLQSAYDVLFFFSLYLPFTVLV